MPKISKNIFKEYDVRGQYPSEIDKNAAYQIGRAFVVKEKLKKVAVVRDSRRESEEAGREFIKGLMDAGVDVYDFGINSSPAMFFAVGARAFDGGTAVTASHNPDGYTGLKMCAKDGVLIGRNNGLMEIARIAEKDFKRSRKKGRLKKVDVSADYFKFISSIVGLDNIKGFKLVLDASGGAGAKMADYVFVRLSSRIIKMNFRRGDSYPDHGLNPMLASNQKLVKAEVKKDKAHLGIIWDGDGDRSIFVDEKGAAIEPYYVNCLLAEIILKKKKGAKIVIDARLPVGLSEVIKSAKGRPVICRSGYANIVKLMHREKILYGCENSGHYFFNFLMQKGNKKNFVVGDAIIPALLILEYLRENNLSLSQAIGKYRRHYLISGELNFKVKNFEKLKSRLAQRYKGREMEEIDGLSVFGPVLDGRREWFFNVRPSHTEPLARLNIEAGDKKTLAKIKKELLEIIK
jgi:phosphomannomutase